MDIKTCILGDIQKDTKKNILVVGIRGTGR